MRKSLVFLPVLVCFMSLNACREPAPVFTEFDGVLRAAGTALGARCGDGGQAVTSLSFRLADKSKLDLSVAGQPGFVTLEKEIYEVEHHWRFSYVENPCLSDRRFSTHRFAIVELMW